MVYSSVVRIFATRQRPDFDNPWQNRSPSRGTGSGVIIAPGRVLTGAHVVANATFLRVQKVSDPDKVVAHIAAICHDCDLALLEVEHDSFMNGVTIEEIGDLPTLRDHVSVVGYPVGGEEISITEGVVSRIEVQRYSHSQRYLLAITVDAAINKGNSGGPVFKDGKICGIAFQSWEDANNIGELVPAPLIRQFLSGVDRHKPAPDAKKQALSAKIPGLGIRTQNLENPLLRKKAGLTAGESGILVTGVEYGGSAWNILKEGDALLEVQGMSISNNGTVQYHNRFRTRYSVILAEKYIGDELDFKILRDGEKRTVSLTLKEVTYLVPRRSHDEIPTYFVYGGMVFQVLTLNFLATWDHWWDKAPPEFLYYYYLGSRTEDYREVVILTQILADEINVGYERMYSEVVASVNGQKPRDMRHFVELVKGSEELVEIRTTAGSMVALDKQDAEVANKRILERYHIPRSMSKDLD